MGIKWSALNAADAGGGALELVGLQNGANVRANAATTRTLIGASDVNHNHNAAYAAIGHNHDASYSAIGHTHDYATLTNKPTLGDSAAKNVGTGANDVAAGNHTHPGGSEAFPVGAVFIAVVNTNPATLLGYGTWSAFAAGRMLVGLNASDTDFDTAEETGGAKTVTLTANEMPSHTHTQDAHTHTQNAHSHVLTELRDATTGGAATNIALTADTSSTLGTKVTGSTTATNQNATATNQNTGGGEAHNNMPPFIVVYMWKRTA